MEKKRKILIVDDEVDFTRLLARRIEFGGYEALPYYQGESVVDNIENGETYCLQHLRAAGFLKKPCDSQLILRTIERTLEPAQTMVNA